MNYEYDLNFLSDILKKCHIHTAVISPLDSDKALLDPQFISIVGFRSQMNVGQLLGVVESKTKYKLSNEFKLRHICIKLPFLSEKNILVIGPYLSAPLSSKDILEIGERAEISPAAQKLLREYYSSVPILSENDKIFVMIDAFCERIWQTQSFAIVELSKSYGPSVLQSDSASHSGGFDEVEANIKMMEMRYAFENELIRAVSLGQQHKEHLLVTQISENMFEKRTTDPIRNAKNYCIIMNTLLRKAAEDGGVHPIYIDRTSSKFAVRIELIQDINACSSLMREMFSSYCRLVYKHSIKRYSPIVQKTILVIDSDISAELSLKTLAQKQCISSGYLASLFKKETGKTVSEYIKDRRIEHAIYLLTTTHLQIQTIALHCGIIDVQYFSKVFKKKTGKNPKEFRSTSRR